jgi:hypothetical protein
MELVSLGLKIPMVTRDLFVGTGSNAYQLTTNGSRVKILKFNIALGLTISLDRLY